MPPTTNRPSEAQDAQAGFIFDRILARMRKRNIPSRAGQIFLMYAHDNPGSAAKADVEMAEHLIKWLNHLQMSIYSDKTALPNRCLFTLTTSSTGSSEDILKSQLCLLPKSSGVPCEKVDQIILCGSEQLKAYEVSSYYQDMYRPTLQRFYDTTDTNDIIPQLSRYINSQREVAGFHHVLTEIAFLEQRMVDDDHGVIPFILNGTAESALPEWATKGTTIRIEAGAYQGKRVDENPGLHRAFFKLLQRVCQNQFTAIERIRCDLYEHFLRLSQTETVTNEHMDIKIDEVIESLKQDGDILWCEHSTQKIVKQSMQEAFEQQTTQSHLTTERELQQWYATTLKERLVIQRVSGKELPMESCYINLAIIESQPKKEEGKELQPSFYRLSSYEQVPNTHLENPISLADLFKPRRLKNGVEGIPKRILVKGRAGVGKTTLAKKSVYDYLNNGLWKEHFDWVLWIPLRRLKGKPECYSCETFLQDEYFRGNRDGESLAAALCQSIQTKPDRALLILDGWDEIAQESRTDCIRTLLNHPSILITTRPSGISSNEIASLDLELETVGFSAANVTAYLDHPAIVLPEISQAIKAFIRNHAFVRALVNIPIQLDALCFSWDEIDPNDPTPTMTGLYQAMTRKLWRKDIINLGRHTALGMTEQQVTVMRQFSGLEAEIQPEQQCLGILALNGLYANQIEFTPSDLETAVKQVETHRIDLYYAMDRLSCLQVERAAGSRTRLSYQFLHLTFQEYFAAQWLVHHLKTNTPLRFQKKTIPINDFIHQEKYNPRYEIVWRFVAGLLANEELTAFFDLLDGGPKDLIGLQHQELLMHCLRESDDRLPHDRKERIEFTLYDWLVFEIDQDVDNYYVSRLGRQAAFPERLLFKQLKDIEQSSKIKRILARTLGARPILSDNAIQALTVLAKDMDRGVRKNAAETLGPVASGSPEALEALCLLAKDADSSVRLHTAKALGQCASGSPKAVEALCLLAKDANSEVQMNAARRLGQCASASPKAVETLFVLAKDANSGVRWNIAEALGPVASGSPEALEALCLLAKDANSGVRLHTAEAFGQCASASPKLLEALCLLVKDANSMMRWYAAEALGQCASVSPKALEALFVLAKDANFEVRWYTARALGQCTSASSKALEDLLLLAKDAYSGVRGYAAGALGQCASASPKALKALCLLAKDADSEVRRHTAKALGQCASPSPKVLKALCLLAKDVNSGVRWNIAEALGPVASASPKALKALFVLAKDADSEVRLHTAGALGQCASASPKVLKALCLLAKDANSGVRWNIAEALGPVASASPKALKALCLLAKDANSEVRLHTAWALGQCASASPKALKALCLLAKDADSEARRHAAWALGQCASASPKALKALCLLAKDADSEVRWNAAEELRNQSLWNIYPLLPTADTPFLSDLYKHHLMPANFKQIVPLYLHANQLCFYTPEGLQSIPMDKNADNFKRTILKAQEAIGMPSASQITIQNLSFIDGLRSYASFFINPHTDRSVSDQCSEETARSIPGAWPMDA